MLSVDSLATSAALYIYRFSPVFYINHHHHPSSHVSGHFLLSFFPFAPSSFPHFISFAYINYTIRVVCFSWFQILSRFKTAITNWCLASSYRITHAIHTFTIHTNNPSTVNRTRITDKKKAPKQQNIKQNKETKSNETTELKLILNNISIDAIISLMFLSIRSTYFISSFLSFFHNRFYSFTRFFSRFPIFLCVRTCDFFPIQSIWSIELAIKY